MGEVGHVNWICKHCDAHRFDCVWCDARQISEGGENEMCERCFYDMIAAHDLVASMKVLAGKLESESLPLSMVLSAIDDMRPSESAKRRGRT